MLKKMLFLVVSFRRRRSTCYFRAR